ncbi:MAG: metallophosphoesterase [Gammaproteobacteria bacterium]
MRRFSAIRSAVSWPALAAGALALLLSPAAGAEARQVGPYAWEGVERIIAIGDLHGDYEQYMKILREAGLVDRRGRWAGGRTHLVQTGDVPDRGPDTRKILDHLAGLKKRAERDGGRVHTLIGNHEAMNVYGDLRYVTLGEYEAFVGRNSEKYRDMLWERTLQNLEARDPEAFAAMDLEAYRKKWEAEYPLGWNEHRQAWIPGGHYGDWVLDNPVAVRINGNLFLHAGLSAKYCEPSLAEITDLVHEGLRNFDYENPGIVEDELGPLWYRGLATDSEAERGEMVAAVLERFEAQRMVVGHTPTQGVVWPRFDGRVILNDTGISAYYGGYDAFLEITPEGIFARYGEHSLPLPQDDDSRVAYLEQVIALDPANAHLQSRLQRMRAALDAPEVVPEVEEDGDPEAVTEKLSAEDAQREAWLSPDNCR